MSDKKEEEQVADPPAPIYETSNRTARSMIAVVDTMCQRGAFKGEELSTIGQLRDQCVQIIQLAENYQQEQATAE
jgi:GAF domain-containing protein